MPRRWPNQSVLAEINARYQETGTIPGIWQNRRLATAAYNRFGSRRAALVAAGIVPPDPPRRTSLTAQAIIKTILARRKLALPLTGAGNPDLLDGARKHFGSWNKALVAAGLAPARPFTPWPEERVVEALRTLKRQGQFEDSTKIVDKNLQSAARRRFGTLRAALVAAGILTSGETVRRKRKWTSERVIKTLQERRLQGLPLRFDSDRRLAMAAWKRFGSWQHALTAAGLRRETGR